LDEGDGVDGTALSRHRVSDFHVLEHRFALRRVLGRRASVDLRDPHCAVVWGLHPAGVHRVLLWVQTGSLFTPGAGEFDPKVSAAAAVVHVLAGAGVLWRRVAIWGGVCGALLHHERAVAAPNLLHLWVPVFGAGHFGGDLRRNHDSHVLLPTLQRRLPVVVAVRALQRQLRRLRVSVRHLVLCDGTRPRGLRASVPVLWVHVLGVAGVFCAHRHHWLLLVLLVREQNLRLDQGGLNRDGRRFISARLERAVT